MSKFTGCMMLNEEQKIADILTPYADEMADERLGIFLSLSVGRVLLRNENIEIQKDDLRHITDWLIASIMNDDAWMSNLDDQRRPKKLMKFSTVEQIVQEANKSMLINSQKLSEIKLHPGDEELFMKLDDNHYIVKLLTPEALDRESTTMQHCIGGGSYDRYLSDENRHYLSLRDKNGKPHATLEVYNDEVLQLQGKQNKAPLDKYNQLVFLLLKEKRYKTDKLSLHRFNYLSDDAVNWHNIYRLPENFTINRNFSLSLLYFPEKFKLPNNLTVLGDLDLASVDIDNLPSGLKVGGNLYLSDLSITKIPDDLKVNKDFCIINNMITEYPGTIEVGGSVQITRCEELIKIADNLTFNSGLTLSKNPKLKELPSKLKVNKNLAILETPISVIPDDLELSGNLGIGDTNISYIRKGLDIKSLHLTNTPINDSSFLEDQKNLHLLLMGKSNFTELPDNLEIASSLDISGNKKIKKLPNGLYVKGSLLLQNTNIKELPEDMKVDCAIDLMNSAIVSIEHIKHVKDALNLLRTKHLKKLPEKLTVDGSLNLVESGISELPNDLTVGRALILSGLNVKTLPKNLKVKCLDISKTEINELPEDIKIADRIIMNEGQISHFPNSIHGYVRIFFGGFDNISVSSYRNKLSPKF